MSADKYGARAFIAECERWLEQDEQVNGTGDAPCSRYGLKPASFHRWAILLAAVYRDANGDDPDETLDGCLSLVVNDADGPAELIADMWYGLTRAVGRRLGITLADVRELIA